MTDLSSNDELFLELIQDFIIESTEGLDRFDRELLELENQGDLETMNDIFRVIHTIKGTAGCLALNNIEKVAHSGENLLSLMRDGKIASSKDIITSLLSLSDVLKDALEILEANGKDIEKDHASLLAELEAHLTRNHAYRAQSLRQNSQPQQKRKHRLFLLKVLRPQTLNQFHKNLKLSPRQLPS